MKPTKDSICEECKEKFNKENMKEGLCIECYKDIMENDTPIWECY